MTFLGLWISRGKVYRLYRATPHYLCHRMSRHQCSKIPTSGHTNDCSRKEIHHTSFSRLQSVRIFVTRYYFLCPADVTGERYSLFLSPFGVVQFFGTIIVPGVSVLRSESLKLSMGLHRRSHPPYYGFLHKILPWCCSG